MDNLKKADPEVHSHIHAELGRQRTVIELIASENIVSKAVLEATGSLLTNKYSEGYPGKRYYGGNEHIDVVENLARERAKQLFGAEHVNVQPHSGSQANTAAYFAILKPGDRILSPDLAHGGGHLTHGSKVNFSGRFYNIVAYGVEKETGMINMNEVRKLAHEHKPKLILAGYSAYPRTLDFAEFRKIADEVGAYFMVDMAHFAGLVAAKVHPSPIPHAHIVTMTTHKTLRGPRGAMILCQKDDPYDPEGKKNLAQKIDSAVFPGNQGGPLDHVIAAKAVSFLEALKPEFVEYQAQVVRNARALAACLKRHGFTLLSGGTDNHLILIDLTNKGVTGKQAETALDEAGLCVNKNMVPFDQRSPFDPSGIRIGTPTITTRGMKEKEMEQIGRWMARIIHDIDDKPTQKQIREKVTNLCKKFPIYE